MKKQTALDYLLSELRSSVLHKNEIRLIRPYIKKAIEIWEEQAFELFKAGQDSMEEDGKNFEQYYNETFGQLTNKSQ